MNVAKRVTENDVRQWLNALETIALSPLPVTDWTLTPSTSTLVAAMIRATRPMSILEFGAGASSVAISRALAANGGGQLTSIDHAPRYCRKAWELVSSESSVDAVLVAGRLKLSFRREGLLYHYRGIDDALASRGPFDLVLIDAPPGTCGRDATLHAAWPHLSNGALVVLDDYARVREQTTVRRWLARYPLLAPVWLAPEFERGVAVFQFHGHTVRSSLRSYLGSIHDHYHFHRTRLAHCEATEPELEIAP